MVGAWESMIACQSGATRNVWHDAIQPIPKAMGKPEKPAGSIRNQRACRRFQRKALTQGKGKLQPVQKLYRLTTKENRHFPRCDSA